MISRRVDRAAEASDLSADRRAELHFQGAWAYFPDQGSQEGQDDYKDQAPGTAQLHRAPPYHLPYISGLWKKM